MAIMAAVLELGANFKLQASRISPNSKTWSACRPNVLARDFVMAIKEEDCRRRQGKTRTNSSVSPLYDKTNITSRDVTRPKSP
jgi:hypothetical protein